MDRLKRSFDRKVANLVTSDGKKARIANCFGLPSGKDYSCPGQTSVCKAICYAGKLEKLYPSVKQLLLHNWHLLNSATFGRQVYLIEQMLDSFESDCDKWQAKRIFRIHWDGDFFSEQYALAWASVVSRRQNIKFWVYTRTVDAAIALRNLPNLSLYFSTDSDNYESGQALNRQYGIKLAMLGNTFADGRQLSDQKSVNCPENARKIPLISTGGSACDLCSLCVDGRRSVVFSISKR
jgi:Gene product 88